MPDSPPGARILLSRRCTASWSGARGAPIGTDVGLSAHMHPTSTVADRGIGPVDFPTSIVGNLEPHPV